MTASPPKKSPETVTSEIHELEQQIRVRAQELYEAGGKKDGQALDDWLRAEAEIMQKKAGTIAA